MPSLGPTVGLHQISMLYYCRVCVCGGGGGSGQPPKTLNTPLPLIHASHGHIHTRRRPTRQGGGGGTALPNSGKTVGNIWAKQEEKKIMCKISSKSTPLPPLTEESQYAHAHAMPWSPFPGPGPWVPSLQNLNEFRILPDNYTHPGVTDECDQPGHSVATNNPRCRPMAMVVCSR